MTAAFRILLVTEASSAGVGRHLMDLAGGLVQRGHSVEVVYSAVRSEPVFLERLRALPGVVAHQLTMRRGPHPTDLAVRRSLRGIVQRGGPFDVVHVHSTKAGLVGRGLGASSGTATVYTPHCLYTMNPDLGAMGRWAIGRLERALAPRTDALIAVSPDEQKHAEDQGLKPKRLVCIPNGIGPLDLEEPTVARQRLGLPTGGQVLGFLGRLSDQKDPRRLLETFAYLRRQRPELVLAAAGTGPLEQDVRVWADELGLGDSVRWLGHQPPERLLPAVDVLCMPSRYEGMPYVLLETGAAGVPIVSTPVGGTSLCVTDGENGSIVPESGPEPMAAAVARWLDDEAACARVRAGAADFAKAFSIDVMVERTLELYADVCAGQARLEAAAP